MPKLRKDTIIKYLITLLPFSLVFSIFITETFLILLTFFYFYEIRKENFLKEIFLNFSFLSFFLFSYFLYVSLNSIFLENEFFLRKTLFYIRFYFYFLSILFFIKKLDLYKLIIRNFFFIFIILILDAIFQFTFGYNIIGMPILIENRISSFFGDESILGSFLTRLLPFFLIFIYGLNQKAFFKLVYILGLIFVVILSGERTALFLLSFSICIYIVLIKKFRLNLIYITGFFLIFFVSLINFNHHYYERYYLNIAYGFGILKSTNDQKTELSVFDSKNNLSLIIFSRHYQDHYESAFKIFKSNPIFGGGTKSFRYLCKKKEYRISSISCSTHPHNITMQFLSELGILGFIFLICFHLLLGKDFLKIFKIKKDVKSKIFLVFSIVGLIINIFPLIPSGNFFNNWLSIIFTLNLVNYIYLREKYLND